MNICGQNVEKNAAALTLLKCRGGGEAGERVGEVGGTVGE